MIDAEKNLLRMQKIIQTSHGMDPSIQKEYGDVMANLEEKVRKAHQHDYP